MVVLIPTNGEVALGEQRLANACHAADWKLCQKLLQWLQDCVAVEELLAGHHFTLALALDEMLKSNFGIHTIVHPCHCCVQ